MKATIEFDKKIVRKFRDTRYYKSNETLIKNMEFMEKEKERYKTQDKDRVTNKIKEILGNINEHGKVFAILEKIYKKNQDYAFKITNEKPLNCDLINLIADEELLLVSYNKIRKNKGAMTEAAEMSEKVYNTLDGRDKSFINRTVNSPDSINIKVFKEVSKLIRRNEYPWGACRRIYVDKPGKKDAKRPITIPPFMDKVVQEAIITVLTTIYEPYFEFTNRSFGFRPNKGVHDAIVVLTSAKTQSLNIALEGDIKSAYDKVDREKLLSIISLKIQDKKFLNFLRKRLDYEFLDTEKNKYVRVEEGLPQGGIDSPYMWNIYMSVFDEFIISEMDMLISFYNNKVRGSIIANKKKYILTSEKRKLDRKRYTLKKIITWLDNLIKINANIVQIEEIAKKGAVYMKTSKIMEGELLGFRDIIKEIGFGKCKDLKEIRKNAIKTLKKYMRENLKLPTEDPNKKRLRYVYVRYADDWILLTNAKAIMLEKIREKIVIFFKKRACSGISSRKNFNHGYEIHASTLLRF